MAVNSMILSKTFDNGVICSSEQSVIVMDSIYKEVKKEFIKRGAYFLKDEREKDVIRQQLFPNSHINADFVGKSVAHIAEKAKIHVPPDCRLLMAEIEDVGEAEVLSLEKLFPVLSIYKVKSFQDCLSKAESLINLCGKGHTSC